MQFEHILKFIVNINVFENCLCCAGFVIEGEINNKPEY